MKRTLANALPPAAVAVLALAAWEAVVRLRHIPEYLLPGPDPTPYALGVDRNNQIWYSSHNMDVIGRLDPTTGKVTEYPVPYPDNAIKEFIMDAQGRMWFGTPPNNKVGYFILSGGS